MQKGRIHSILIIAVVVLLGFSSCGERPHDPLNRAQRELKDSLITEGLKQEAALQDSLCTIHGDSLIQHFYDSLLIDRLEEIEKLRRRR